jgi:hypothetical protein
MKAAVVVLGVVALCIGALLGLRQYQHHNRVNAPDRAFVEITGSALPPALKATAYNSELTDNLFHSSHYWLLSGPDQELRSFAISQGFAESSEDARHAVPNLPELFGRPATGFVAGYEKDNGRNSWLILLEGVAVYVHE